MASEQEVGPSEGCQRRSERKRKDRQPVFSPDDFESKKKAVADIALSSASSLGKKCRHAVRRRYPAASGTDRPHDVLPNGEPFSCDLCQSPYVCNPLLSKRGSRGHRSRHMPSPRQKLNTNTGKLLTLCNACADSLDGPRPPKPVVKVSQEEKDAYCKQAKAFASQLSAQLQDEDVERFYCPMYNKTPCGCLQKHLKAEGNTEQTIERGKELLQLYKQARNLASEKVYNLDELVKKYACRKKAMYGSIGIGNGNKHSKRFEAFILQHRVRLKCDLHLCERATQRILCYSNNFLHKKLKTDERGSRVVRQKGKAALGLLDPLESLSRRRCCVDQCVRMVNSHRNLVTQWRKRAVLNQNEARRVLAEMLTPSGGVRCNCYKFINWVTGCSLSTIGKVRDQMRRTKGDREPPQHGLYTYWELKASCRQHKAGLSKHRTQPSATVTPDQHNSDFRNGVGVFSDASPSSEVSLTAVTGGIPVGHTDAGGRTQQLVVHSSAGGSSDQGQPGVIVDEASHSAHLMESQRQQLLQLQDQLLQQQASISCQQQSVEQQFGWSHSASNLVNIQQQVLQQMSQLHSAQQSLASSIHTLQQQLATLQPATQPLPLPQHQHHLVPQLIQPTQVVDIGHQHLVSLGAQWAAPVAQQQSDTESVQQHQHLIPVGTQQVVSLSAQQSPLSIAQQPPDCRNVLQQQLIPVGGGSEHQHLVSLGVQQTRLGSQPVVPPAGVPLQHQFAPAAPTQQVPDSQHPRVEVVTTHLNAGQPQQYLAPVDGTQWIVQQQGVCGPGPLQAHPQQPQSGMSTFTQLVGSQNLTTVQQPPPRYQQLQQQQSPNLQASSSSQAFVPCVDMQHQFQGVASAGQVAAVVQDGGSVQQNAIRQQWSMPQPQQQAVTTGQQAPGSAQSIMLTYIHPGLRVQQPTQPSQHNLLQPAQHQNLQSSQPSVLQSAQQNLQPMQQNVIQSTQQNLNQTTQQNLFQPTQQNLPKSAQQNILQSTQQNLILSTQQNLLQSTQQNLLQSTQQNLQSTQQIFQSTQHSLLQSTQQNLLQSTQQNLLQPTQQNPVQSMPPDPASSQQNLRQPAQQVLQTCEALQPPSHPKPHPATTHPLSASTLHATATPSTEEEEEPQGNQQLFRPPPYQMTTSGGTSRRLCAPASLVLDRPLTLASSIGGASCGFIPSASMAGAVPLVAGVAQTVPPPAGFSHLIPVSSGVVQAVPGLSAGTTQNAAVLTGVAQIVPVNVPMTLSVPSQNAPLLTSVTQAVSLSSADVTHIVPLSTSVTQTLPLSTCVTQTVPLPKGVTQTVLQSVGATQTYPLTTGQPNLHISTAGRPNTQISTVVRPDAQTKTAVRPNTQTTTAVRPNTQTTTAVRPNTQTTTAVRPNTQITKVMRPNAQTKTAVRSNAQTSTAATPYTRISTAMRPNAQTSSMVTSNVLAVTSRMSNTQLTAVVPSSHMTFVRPKAPTSTLTRPSTASVPVRLNSQLQSPPTSSGSVPTVILTLPPSSSAETQLAPAPQQLVLTAAPGPNGSTALLLQQPVDLSRLLLCPQLFRGRTVVDQPAQDAGASSGIPSDGAAATGISDLHELPLTGSENVPCHIEGGEASPKKNPIRSFAKNGSAKTKGRTSGSKVSEAALPVSVTLLNRGGDGGNIACPPSAVESSAAPSLGMAETVTSAAVPHTVWSVMPQATPSSALPLPVRLPVIPQAAPSGALAQSVLPQSVPLSDVPPSVLPVTPPVAPSSAFPQPALSVMPPTAPTSAIPQPALSVTSTTTPSSALSKPAMPVITPQVVPPAAAVRIVIPQPSTLQAFTPQPTSQVSPSTVKSKPRTKAAQGVVKQRPKGKHAREKEPVVAVPTALSKSSVAGGAASCSGPAGSLSRVAQTGPVTTALVGSATDAAASTAPHETLAMPLIPLTHVIPRTNRASSFSSPVTTSTAVPVVAQATPLAAGAGSFTDHFAPTNKQVTPTADQTTPSKAQAPSFSNQPSLLTDPASSVVSVATCNSQAVVSTAATAPNLRSVPTLLLSSSGVQPSGDIIAVLNFTSDAGSASTSLRAALSAKTSSASSRVSSALATTTTVSAMPPSLRSVPTVLLSTSILAQAACSGSSVQAGAKRSKACAGSDFSVTSSVAAAASLDADLTVSPTASRQAQEPKRKRKRKRMATQAQSSPCRNSDVPAGFTASVGGNLCGFAGVVPAGGISPSLAVAYSSVPPTVTDAQASIQQSLSAITTAQAQDQSKSAAAQIFSIASTQSRVLTTLATTQSHASSDAGTHPSVPFFSTPQSSVSSVATSQVQIQLAPVIQSSRVMAHSQITSTGMVQSQRPAFAIAKSSISSVELGQHSGSRMTAPKSEQTSAAVSKCPEPNARRTVPLQGVGTVAGRTVSAVTVPVQVTDVAVPPRVQAGTASSMAQVANLPVRLVDSSVHAPTTPVTLPHRSAAQVSTVSLSKTSNSGMATEQTAPSSKSLPMSQPAKKKRGTAKGVRHSSTLISAMAGPPHSASDAMQVVGTASFALAAGMLPSSGSPVTSVKTTAQAKTSSLPSSATSVRSSSPPRPAPLLRPRTTSTGFAVCLASTQTSSQPAHNFQGTVSSNTTTHTTTQLLPAASPQSRVLTIDDAAHQTTPDKTSTSLSVQISPVLYSQKESTTPLPISSSPSSLSLPQTTHGPPACQTGSLQPPTQAGPASQNTPAGFPVSVMPVGEGKQQMMCITSPMNFQQLKVLLSHLKLPVGSVVKQISSPVKGGPLPSRVGLAEVILPKAVGPDTGERAASTSTAAQIQQTMPVSQNATPLVQQTTSLDHHAVTVVQPPQVQQDTTPPSLLATSTTASLNATPERHTADVAMLGNALPAASQDLSDGGSKVISKDIPKSGYHRTPRKTGRGKLSKPDKTPHVAAVASSSVRLAEAANRSERGAFEEIPGPNLDQPESLTSDFTGCGIQSTPSSLADFRNATFAKPSLNKSSARSGQFSSGCSSFVAPNPSRKYHTSDQYKPQPTTSPSERLSRAETSKRARTSTGSANLLGIVSFDRNSAASLDTNPPKDTPLCAVGTNPSMGNPGPVATDTRGTVAFSARTSSVPPEDSVSLRLSEPLPSDTSGFAPATTARSTPTKITESSRAQQQQGKSASSRQHVVTYSLQNLSSLQSHTPQSELTRNMSTKVSSSSVTTLSDSDRGLRGLKTRVDPCSVVGSEKAHTDSSRRFSVVETHTSSSHLSGSVKTFVNSNHMSSAEKGFHVDPSHQAASTVSYQATNKRPNEHPTMNDPSDLVSSAPARLQIQSGAGHQKNMLQTPKSKLSHVAYPCFYEAGQAMQPVLAETKDQQTSRMGVAVTEVWHKQDSRRMPPHRTNNALRSSLPPTFLSSDTEPADCPTRTTTTVTHIPGVCASRPTSGATVAGQDCRSSVPVTLTTTSYHGEPSTPAVRVPVAAVNSSAPVGSSTAPSSLWPVSTATYTATSSSAKLNHFALEPGHRMSAPLPISWAPVSSRGDTAASDMLHVSSEKASIHGQGDRPLGNGENSCGQRDRLHEDRPGSPHGLRPGSYPGHRRDNSHYRGKLHGNGTDRENPNGHRTDTAFHREHPLVHRTGNPLHKDNLSGHRSDNPHPRDTPHGHRNDSPVPKGNPNRHRPDNTLLRENSQGPRTDNSLHRDNLHGHRTITPLHRDNLQGHRSDNSLLRDNLQGHRSDNSLLRDNLQGHRSDNSLLRDNLQGHRSDNLVHRDHLHGHRSDNPVHRDNLQGHRSDNPVHRDNLQGHRSDNHVHRDHLQGHRSDNSLHRDNLQGHRSDNSLHRDNLQGHRNDNPHVQRADNTPQGPAMPDHPPHEHRPGHTSPHPVHFTPFDCYLTASPAAVVMPPSCSDAPDDTSRDMEYLSSSSFFPFMSTSSRSRNSSGASSIEPTIAIDPALLPFDFMQIMSHQGGLAVAVTGELAPPGGSEDST